MAGINFAVGMESKVSFGSPGKPEKSEVGCSDIRRAVYQNGRYRVSSRRVGPWHAGKIGAIQGDRAALIREFGYHRVVDHCIYTTAGGAAISTHCGNHVAHCYFIGIQCMQIVPCIGPQVGIGHDDSYGCCIAAPVAINHGVSERIGPGDTRTQAIECAVRVVVIATIRVQSQQGTRCQSDLGTNVTAGAIDIRDGQGVTLGIRIVGEHATASGNT